LLFRLHCLAVACRRAAAPGLQPDAQSLPSAAPRRCLSRAPPAAGRTFKEVRRAFSTGIVVGFTPPGPGARVSLNPKDSEAVPAGSQLVFVASSQSVQRAEKLPSVRAGGGGERASKYPGCARAPFQHAFSAARAAPARAPAPARRASPHPAPAAPRLPARPPAQTSLPKLRRCRGSQMRKRHIAVLCFEPSAASMLEALKDFAPRGSRVTLVCRWGVGGAAERDRVAGLGHRQAPAAGVP
jgi:hypothetical protein